ncbi:hypothetical protein ASF57_06625 [Methylobacterium sp. Leaf117]|nr:hypothetical protein ASF57_06625 [Methylobacterium sp. Leaf117]
MLLGGLEVLQVREILKVLEDGVARVVVLAPAGMPRQGLQAVFDLGRPAQGEHRRLLRGIKVQRGRPPLAKVRPNRTVALSAPR